MKKKMKNPVVITCLLLLVLFAAVVAGLARYASTLKNTFQEEAITYLQEIASQGVNALNRQIDAELEELSDLALYIGRTETLEMDEALPILNEIAYKNSFKRMGIITPDGAAETTDGVGMYLGDREYFKKTKLLQTAVSEVLVDKADGEKINVYAAPIVHEGTFLGTLFATHEVNTYQHTLSISYFEGRGYSYIISQNGDIIVESATGRKSAASPNIFDSLTAQGYDGAEEMRQAVSRGESGIIEYSAAGEQKYMNYTPLHVNGWYLLTVIPKSVVSQKLSYIMGVTVLILSGIALLFILLIAGIVLMQSRNRKKLSLLAFYDSLTGLPNQNKFIGQAAELLKKRGDASWAVIQIDVDNFKYINERFGYDTGDSILCHLADGLQRELHDGEIAARNGGDHFLLLLSFESQTALKVRISELTNRLRRCPVGNHMEIELLFSVGVYVVESRIMDVSQMIDCTTVAQKSVKGVLRSTYAFYSKEIHDRVIFEKDLENQAGLSLRNGEFEVYYQPKCDVYTGRVTGAEALVRWRHPQHGLIMPDRFILLFERNGFILELDEYIFNEACKDVKRWAERGAVPVPVSVNLSRLHLNDASFVNTYQRMAQNAGISPKMIELEITENVVFDHSAVLNTLISKLHKIGFTVSMDDFGSGYSSLNMLSSIDVDVLKLDRGFFNSSAGSEKGKRVIQTIVRLAEHLHMEVVAEGVETAEQAKFLREIGCRTAQGYYYSRPVPEEEFERMLTRKSRTVTAEGIDKE